MAEQMTPDQQAAAEAAAGRNTHVLLVARFPDTVSAMNIYSVLREAETNQELEIDGVLVVKADDKGRLHVQKMTDHSTRKGLKWGIVGGAVAAVFLPATIVGGAVALGIAGATAGKARNLNRRIQVEKELAPVIKPGTSGIVCLASASAADYVTKVMPDAEEVKRIAVDAETADAVKAASAAASATEASDIVAREEAKRAGGEAPVSWPSGEGAEERKSDEPSMWPRGER